MRARLASQEGPDRADREVEEAHRLDAMRRPTVKVPDTAEPGIERADGQVVVQIPRPDQPVTAIVPGDARSDHDAEPGRGPGQRAVGEFSRGHRVAERAVSL